MAPRGKKRDIRRTITSTRPAGPRNRYRLPQRYIGEIQSGWEAMPQDSPSPEVPIYQALPRHRKIYTGIW